MSSLKLLRTFSDPADLKVFVWPSRADAVSAGEREQLEAELKGLALEEKALAEEEAE